MALIFLPKEAKETPVSVNEGDFSQYHRIICLDKEEHKPMVESRFPKLERDLEYWEMPDIHLSPAYLILPQIHEKILQLVRDMSLAENKISR